jgi:hypothetical protein
VFKGFVVSESLGIPTLLNDLAKVGARIEEHLESPDTPYWHVFKVEVPDDDIDEVAERYAAAMKQGWYAHFWNSEHVIVSFPGRVFKIPREAQWSSEACLDARSYGLEHGVEERYLDFWIED